MLIERTIGGLHESLVPFVSALPRTPVLDLGCGTGAWIERLRSLGFSDLTGVDMEGNGFIRANLDTDELPLARKFGLITAIEIIEHLENPGRLLSIASELLEPGGVLLITTPNIQSLHFRLKFLLTGRMPSFDSRGDPTHLTPLLLDGFKRSIPRHGFVLERIWTYPEHRSLIFGRAVKALAAVTHIVAPDPLPGDNLCLMLRRT